MRHGSLFSGIGGFDLAAEWMGWENVFHCEWNEFGQRVLKHYWPNAESFSDITKTDFTKYEGTIDIISGGFPCQPYSTAGKRKGKNDERHLWPEMLRAIREIKPRFVVGENVRGLTNWNGGLVFDEVCAELEALGYQVAPVIIPACAVNAPHRRERIWFVAKNTGSDGRIQRESKEKGTEIWQQRNISTGSADGVYLSEGITTNTSIERPIQCGISRKISKKETIPSQQGSELGIRSKAICNGFKPNWKNFPTQSPICGGDDGIPTELDGITFSKWRAESIKGYGNAIVPQVAYEIFKAIILCVNSPNGKG